MISDTLFEAVTEIERYQKDFRAINKLLKAAGVSSHKEKPAGAEYYWQAGMGYSSIHFLRRFAAALAVNGDLPEPLKRSAKASSAPELQTYSQQREKSKFKGAYDHLVCHSDADGYYVPVDFSQVLNTDQSVSLTGGYLGSSVRLQHECQTLAKHLELPEELDFDTDDDDEWKQLKKATRGAAWHQYPIEAFVCVVLLQACEWSIKQRAAIEFG